MANFYDPGILRFGEIAGGITHHYASLRRKRTKNWIKNEQIKLFTLPPLRTRHYVFSEIIQNG